MSEVKLDLRPFRLKSRTKKAQQYPFNITACHFKRVVYRLTNDYNLTSNKNDTDKKVYTVHE